MAECAESKRGWVHAVLTVVRPAGDLIGIAASVIISRLKSRI